MIGHADVESLIRPGQPFSGEESFIAAYGGYRGAGKSHSRSRGRKGVTLNQADQTERCGSSGRLGCGESVRQKKNWIVRCGKYEPEVVEGGRENRWEGPARPHYIHTNIRSNMLHTTYSMHALCSTSRMACMFAANGHPNRHRCRIFCCSLSCG